MVLISRIPGKLGLLQQPEGHVGRFCRNLHLQPGVSITASQVLCFAYSSVIVDPIAIWVT